MWKTWDPVQRLVLVAGVIVLLAVGVWPVLDLLWDSVHTDQGFTLQRYDELLHSHRVQGLLLKTIRLAVAATIGALILGVPYAFIVTRCNIPFRAFFAVVGFLPFILSPHIQVVAWVEYYINLMIEYKDLPVSVYGETGVVVVEALTYFSLVYIITFFGLRSLDRTQEEAAYVARGLGATLRSITLPAVMPYIATSAILTFLFAVANFGVPGLLRIQVYAVEMLFQIASFNDIAQAAAISAPFVVLGLVLLTLQWFFEGRMRTQGTAGFGVRPRVYDVGLLRWPAFAFTLVVSTLTFFLPVGVLVRNSGSLQLFIDVLGNPRCQKDLANTLLLAMFAATATTLLGALVAFFMSTQRPATYRLLDFLTLLPFALPPSLLGIKLATVWNTSILTQFIAATVIMSVLAFFCRFVTFPVKIVSVHLKQVDPYLAEASQLANVPWWKHLWLMMSLNAKSLWASWLLVYILVTNELGINLLIDPAGFNTLTTRIFNLFHYGRADVVAALSLVSTAVLAIPFVLYLLLFQRKGLKAV